MCRLPIIGRLLVDVADDESGKFVDSLEIELLFKRLVVLTPAAAAAATDVVIGNMFKRLVRSCCSFDNS